MKPMATPERLQQIVDVMRSSPKEFRIDALLDFSRRVPALPEGMSSAELEQVKECQTPFFLASRVDEDHKVHMFFDAPPESPTVRGFAGILLAGLDGAPVDDVLAVPDDFFYDMGLEEVVSPLRLRGMGMILARLKRQVREAVAS
jgi:cysteine desulfuration protein SufE